MLSIFGERERGHALYLHVYTQVQLGWRTYKKVYPCKLMLCIPVTELVSCTFSLIHIKFEFFIHMYNSICIVLYI